MTRRRVREAAPLQVYLVADERQRLDRLADQLDTSKSDVVRRALEALERELMSPAGHPALSLIGIAREELPGAPAGDAGRDHDQLIADSEEGSWRASAAGGSKRSSTRSAKKRRAR